MTWRPRQAARRAELTFPSTGAGTASHLGASLLNLEAGVTAIHVLPAPGDTIVKVVAKVAAGVTHYLLSPIAIVKPYLEAGTLVALAVSTACRSPWLPDVPTVAEQGIDGYDFPIWFGAWVRAGTSSDIVLELGNSPSEAMTSPDLKEWCALHGVEQLRMTTDDFARFVTNEAERARAIIRKGPSD